MWTYCRISIHSGDCQNAGPYLDGFKDGRRVGIIDPLRPEVVALDLYTDCRGVRGCFATAITQFNQELKYNFDISLINLK